MSEHNKVSIEIDGGDDTASLKLDDKVIPGITHFSVWSSKQDDGTWQSSLSVTQETKLENGLTKREYLEWDSGDAKLKNVTAKVEKDKLKKFY